MKIIEYKLVCSSGGINSHLDALDNSIFPLDDAVMAHINEGWQPYGVPFVSIERCYQAMVKYEVDLEAVIRARDALRSAEITDAVAVEHEGELIFNEEN